MTAENHCRQVCLKDDRQTISIIAFYNNTKTVRCSGQAASKTKFDLKMGGPRLISTFPWAKNFALMPLSSQSESKGSVSQLMDDLDLINSVEKVEAMVNSIQKGVENVLRK